MGLGPVVTKRQNPARAQMARVGNYVAPVDTTGLDPEMKATMGIGVKPKAKAAMSPLDKLMQMFGMGPKVKQT